MGENESQDGDADPDRPARGSDDLGTDAGGYHVQSASSGTLYLVRTTNLTATRQQQLAALGANVTDTFGPYAELRIEPRHRDRIRQQSWVTGIERVVPVGPQTTSEGVSTINADDVQSTGYTGSGVDVGIIDGGFDTTNPEISSQVESTAAFSGNGISNGGDSGHGTGVAEIVTDVAPDVDLHLATARTSSEVVEAIRWLRQQNVDVITMSLGSYGGRQDGTSMDAQAATEAVQNGITFTVAAGNEGAGHWQGQFRDPDGDDLLEVNGREQFYLNGGDPLSGGVSINLQWHDWPSSNNDYDLYVYREISGRDDELVGYSALEQSGSRAPVESVAGRLPQRGTYYVVVESYSTTGTHTMELFVKGTTITPSNPAGSINSPAAARGVVGVGAFNYAGTTLASYSSQGPTDDGRRGVDIVGPAGVTTSTLNPFRGTSAATPHVAGTAALVVDKNPFLSPQAVQQALGRSAINMGPAGPDPATGFGRLDASGAVAAVDSATDSREPNDSPGTATPVSQVPTSYDDLTILDGETDQFAVDADAGTWLNATATFDHSQADLTLAVLAPNRTVVARSRTATDDERVQAPVDTDGTWYVAVSGSANASARYSLDLATSPRSTPGPDHRPSVELTGTGPQIAVRPGNETTVTVTLENTGGNATRGSLALTPESQHVSVVSENPVRYRSGPSNGTAVTEQFTLSVDGSAPDGSYTVDVNATLANTVGRDNASTSIRIPVSDGGRLPPRVASDAPEEVTPGETVTFSYNVTNTARDTVQGGSVALEGVGAPLSVATGSTQFIGVQGALPGPGETTSTSFTVQIAANATTGQQVTVVANTTLQYANGSTVSQQLPTTFTIVSASPVARFDTNGQSGIQPSEVVDAIVAYNAGSTAGGDPVTGGDVVDVIVAFNN